MKITFKIVKNYFVLIILCFFFHIDNIAWKIYCIYFYRLNLVSITTRALKIEL